MLRLLYVKLFEITSLDQSLVYLQLTEEGSECPQEFKATESLGIHRPILKLQPWMQDPGAYEITE